MSKIGRVNLELQEQANELGFSTVQEALDNGYEVIQRTMGAPRDLDEIDREPEVWYELQKKDELEEAHKAWLKEKEEVLESLDEIATYFESMGCPENYVPTKHGKTIRYAIEFIEKWGTNEQF